jgi:hypothetical protein
MSYEVVTETEDSENEDARIFHHKIDEIVNAMRDIETFKIKKLKENDELKNSANDYLNSLIRTYQYVFKNYPELLL